MLITLIVCNHLVATGPRETERFAEEFKPIYKYLFAIITIKIFIIFKHVLIIIIV